LLTQYLTVNPQLTLAPTYEKPIPPAHPKKKKKKKKKKTWENGM
jgi:hypothetical protein